MQKISFLTKTIGSNLFLFFLLLFIVSLIQYDLLRPALEIGLTPDDWAFTFWYKTFGSNPFANLPKVWAVYGPYTTVPIYYTGIIVDFVNFNYKNLQLLSILFKILATLVVYPLILIVFKNKFLAFLTTILFAMTYPSSGPLETAVEPTEYLGLFFTGLFLISYYYLIKSRTNRMLFITSTVLLLVALGISIMRVYPLLLFLLIIEFYLFIRKPSKVRFKEGLLRLLILFSPIILIILYRPNLVLSYIYQPNTLFSLILRGNWQLILTPIQGLGHILPLNNYWGFLGSIKLKDFSQYLSFFLSGPLIIFGTISLFLSWLTSKNPLGFFITVFIPFLFFGIAIFFITDHRFSLPQQLQMSFDAPRIYPVIIGIFLLILAIAYFIEWFKQGKKVNWLLASWLGIFGAIIFIVMTWLLASTTLSFGGSQDHYLMIPSVGTSLFLASIIIILFEKLNKSKATLLVLFIPLFSMLIILFYLSNRQLIHDYFDHANLSGRAASGQILLQSRFKEIIKPFNKKEPMLFYFDTSEIENGPFYTESFLSSLPFWMRFQGNQLVEGCSEVLYLSDHKQLLSHIKEISGQKDFYYRSLCFQDGKGQYKSFLYKPENFYAYKLKNKNFIDIKKDLLLELGF